VRGADWYERILDPSIAAKSKYKAGYQVGGC
jgi:hypothetical protein